MMILESLGHDSAQLNEKDKIGCIFFRKLDDETVYIEAFSDVRGEFSLSELLLALGFSS